MTTAARPPTSADPVLALEVEGLRLLLDVSRRINAEVDPDAVLATVVDSLVSITRADRGFLMLRQSDGSLRFTIARDRTGKPLEEKKFRVSQSIVNEVAETGVTRLIDDAATSDAHARAHEHHQPLAPHDPVRRARANDRHHRRHLRGQQRDHAPVHARDVPLVEAFAAQAAATLDRLRLQRVEVEQRAHAAASCEVAAEIQKTFLPGNFPDLEGIRGAVATVPALDVGGDFYDVIRLPRGRVGVMVGDVLGQGRPRGALRRAADVGRALRGALPRRRRRDAHLGQPHRGRSASCAGCSSRSSTPSSTRRTVDVVLRQRRPPGADRPARRRPARRWEDARAACRSASSPDVDLPRAHEAARAPATCSMLLSDGIVDAVGEKGERFGDERVAATISKGTGDPAALVKALCEAHCDAHRQPPAGRRPDASRRRARLTRLPPVCGGRSRRHLATSS